MRQVIESAAESGDGEEVQEGDLLLLNLKQ